MSIRTTVTLDEDVYERLKEESRRRGVPFRQTLNEMVRRGFAAAGKPKRRTRFVAKAKDLGLRPGLSYDNTEELLEYAEGPSHR